MMLAVPEGKGPHPTLMCAWRTGVGLPRRYDPWEQRWSTMGLQWPK